MGSWKPSIHLVVFTLFWGALVLSRKTRRHSVNSRKYYRTLYIPLEVFFSCAFNIALPDDSVTQTAQPSNTEESNDDLEDEVSFWRFLSLSKPKAGSEKPQSEKSTKTSLLYHIMNSPVDEEQENMRSDFIRSYFRSRNSLGTYTERITPFAYMCIIVAVIVVVLVVIFVAYLMYCCSFVL